MTDVQVSNARRVGFTTLAVVSLWILTLREYSIASDDAYGFILFMPNHDLSLGLRLIPTSGGDVFFFEDPSRHSVYLAASMALVPMAFIAISISNTLSRLLDPWIAVSAALAVTTVLVARWLGLDYSWMDAHYDVETWENSFRCIEVDARS